MIDLIWLKNDLRIQDNPCLYGNNPMVCFYIIPEKIQGYQLWWTLNSLIKLQKSLKNHNIPLVITDEKNYETILLSIKNNYGIKTLRYNKSYESYWIQWENKINDWAQKFSINYEITPSNTLLDPLNIFNKMGQNYKVFTPFWKYVMVQEIPQVIHIKPQGISINIEDIIIEEKYKKFLEDHEYLHKYWNPGEEEAQEVLEFFIKNNLKKYKDFRNFPATPTTSKLSPYLRSGNISSRQVYWAVKNSKINDELTEPFLRQLGWREFSFHLLAHYPRMENENLHREFDGFPWHYDEKYYKAWQDGMTGYPIVDAGMRELKATGWLHNRLRLIIGSFLTKDLRIHWTYGAQHFWHYLMDADEANNSASWQWVAGCGMDAAPYYRIFNPVLQSMKFDPDGIYIKQWIPELKNLPAKFIHDPWNYDLSSYNISNYPKPIIDHKIAKQVTLDLYFDFFKGKKDN